ncbi:TonB-dependent receptor [Sphingopyxis sp. JAI128]|uniref:TonB-dependent receptor n=1 Tax=Sphingopyxis sp. JAI128 TaxID=2723066 RepID=UPI001613F316|nr:TonB-dependent receptor [Sphingopyxis sp. JAI128]MBB6427880.1 outer membrane receptor protein involved in Fe transport [Sphingopyxis sp. JAI128]
MAQTAPAEVIAEGDIVVTAQKREERLQDVPAAVSVLSATTLATANQTRLRDYFDTVPSFQVSPSPGGGNQQSLAIRGVSSGAYANPTVGIMIDEVPFGAVTYDFSPEVDPSDLARIEVLRGPQGTLYGASSIGGLVKFVTLDPSTSDVSARAEAGVNTISHGDKLGYSVKGSLNLPLSSTLAVRISAFNREDPGYIDNPTTGREDVNSLRATGARFSALWNATDNISVKLNALYQRSRADGSSEEIHGFGLTDYQQNYIANTGQSGKTIQSYSAIINAGFGAVDVTSVSGYSHYKVFSVQDYTNNAPWGARAQLLFGTPGASSRFNAGVDRFTQEVRATFKTGEALDWLVGAFYSNEDTPIFQSIAAANVTTGAILGDILNFDIPFKQKEFAVFADPTLHLFDRFSIQFGARYSWLDATFDSVRQEGRLLAAPVVLPAITQKANVFTYLVTPQFKVNRDLMIYGRVATGYRPGRSNSFNPDLTVPRAADADTTTNYEIGIKGALLSNMLSFDASLYHIDWKDIQITLVSVNNGIAYTANAARAKSQGFELSSTLRPGGGLTVAGWLSFNHAVVTEGVVNAATFAPAGARLPFSTKFTANISADQKFEISGDLTGSVGITFGHTGKRFGTFIGNPNRSVYPAFNKIDLRAGLEYGPWAFNVYARNIGDTHGLLGGGAGSFPPSAFTYIQPRSIGASLSRTF